MATRSPQWFPIIATPNFFAIAEECDCICKEKSPAGDCCCHGLRGNGSCAVHCVTRKAADKLCGSPLDDFDGVEDILAVSHVTEKPAVKKKPPLLRAKTLPAIITPSLSILQAQLDTKAKTAAEPPNQAKGDVSPATGRGKRGSAGGITKPKSSRDSQKQYLYTEEDDDFAGGSKSPSISPRNSLSSIGSSSSSQFGKDSSKKGEHGGTPTSRAALAKLARLLTQKDKSISDRSPTFNNVSSPDAGLRKASSIDSLLDSCSSHGIDISVSSCSATSPPGASLPVSSALTPGTLNIPTANGTPIPLSPSVPAKLESQKRGNIPTSPSVPSKLAKNASGRRQGSMDLLLEGVSLTKAERKKLEKLNKFNFDLQALFAAVEHEHLERARSILETTDVDINSVNADGFTPLDIAVMTMNIPMVKLLQSFGGKERSDANSSKDTRSTHLNTLVKEAEKCMEDLTTCVLSAATNGNLSTALLKEKERQLTLWERRHRLLKKMKTGYEQIRCPDPPVSVQLEVVGTRSLKVKFVEPETANDTTSIVTKYRVEWSCYDDFSPLAGSQEITEFQKSEITIPDLTQGVSYFVRVAAGNAKGYSNYQATSPLSAAPSSWRDLDERVPRSEGKLGALDDIFHQIINSRPEHAAEIKGISDSCDTPQQQRRLMRKSIKNLFTPAPRFQKCMKRGVFLACLFYNEDKVLVTTEETLPIIEVDESFPSSLHTDFHWMLKVACTWEDVKSLRMEMEKSHSSSSVHFRSKLLQAVEQMQSALGLQDLGQLFYKPLKDTEGTIVLCTVKYIGDPKSLNSLSVRWLPLAKIQRKLSSMGEGSESTTVGELLMSTLQEMITYNQLSSIPLSRGLYLGYVKLKSSVDLIRVLVPRKMPNVLPHCRVRENPHVSREEWDWIKNMAEGDKRQQTAPTEIQRKFQKLLASASKNMLAHLEIPEDQFDGHRIYDAEVIELSPDVSLILLLPPIDSVCSVPGQSDDLTSRTDFILLPVQIFEMTHMRTYQNNFIARYSRISSILEMDTMVAQHAHREAFSSSEVAASKLRLSQLQDFQTQVDNIWRGMRWIMDVVTFARDKQSNSGIPLGCIWTQISEMPSPNETPHQSPTQQAYLTPRDDRHLTREEYEKKILLRITASSSSYSLVDTITVPDALDIRRCASTSRLFQNGVDNASDHSASTISFNPEATSCEHLNVSFDNDESIGISITCGPAEEASEQGAPMDEEALSSKRNSLHSSCTGSMKSVSSHDIEASVEEEASESISVYSKDSACSVEEGAQVQKLPSIEDPEDVEFFRRPSSANSTSSNSSAPSECLPGILRVYAAYDTGLPSGTSVKLHVTPQTRAREVVDLVVKQLNMAVILKGKGGPIYGSNQLQNFCLVAVVGTREKCLSDSFQPLKLQNPWTNGKLYVKKKSAVNVDAEEEESPSATV